MNTNVVIVEITQGNSDRLECPYCKKRISALGINKNSIISNVTVQCQKCKRILEIKQTNKN